MYGFGIVLLTDTQICQNAKPDPPGPLKGFGW